MIAGGTVVMTQGIYSADVHLDGGVISALGRDLSGPPGAPLP